MESRSFKTYVEQKFGKIPQFFIYAVLELFVIILLLINGLIAFVVNEFARFFELETPCLLCTRIDHLLFRKNSNTHYNESLCEDHKKHVSSLAYCNIHKKLSDVRFICEGCLLSFATENKSNSETYKSLVGILGSNLECSVEDDHKIHLRLPAAEKKGRGSVHVEKSSIHLCSCCREPRKVRTSLSHAIVQNPVSNEEVEFPKVPMTTPRGLVTAVNGECKSSDPLPHVQYSELSYVSDSESEIPEEVDSSNAIISLESQGKEDTKAASVPLLPDFEDLNEDSVCKTPSCIRTNRFYGIGFTDSATASPRWPIWLRRGSSGEKAESGTESAEGNSASETEGDTILHHLKRQVRLDRKTLVAMYMELDEERSASAVAANQAMAMITRLQAEKAAVQMEALQYQRMMEEQAEYDMEAVQVLKELLNRREDEIKILEAELKAYRRRHECEGEMSDDNYRNSSFRCNSFANSDGGSTHANIEMEVEGDGECERASVQPEPSQVQPKPTKVQPELPHVQPELPQVKPEPSQVQPEPSQVQPKPTKVQPEPPHVQPELPQVQPEPSQVQPKPTKVQPEPPHVQPELPQVQPEPSQVQPEPSQVQPEPSQVQPEPSQVQSKPTKVQPEPPHVQPEPSQVQPEPSQVQPKPTKVQPEPPHVQPEPSQVQPKPTKVQPKPPQVQPEPPQVQHRWIKVDESLIDFEGERLYLMDHLRILERKIRCSPSNGVFSRLHSSDLSNLKEEDRGEGTTNIKINREITHFYEKLLALETDREFLKHAFLSLHKGDEGTRLLRELVQHLRYLRHMPLEG